MNAPRKEDGGTPSNGGPGRTVLHRTKRGFQVVEYRNDLDRLEYQVRNWRGTVLTTRRDQDAAITRADELDRMQGEKEGKHGKRKE
jgi:hypothetical protein